MSSARLQAPPADAGQTLKAAFIDVCENSFFAFVEQCPPERFVELVNHYTATRRGDGAGAASRESEWLKASVGFTGVFGGAIEVAVKDGKTILKPVVR